MIANFIGDGEEYPTVGISFGLSAIYEIIKTRFDDVNSNTLVYIIPMGTEIECLKIANTIRNNNYSVEIEMNNKKLKKSMEYANKQGIKYVIVIGTNEIEANTIFIKNMLTGKQDNININKISDYKFM